MKEQSQRETEPVIVNFLKTGNEGDALVERAVKKLPVAMIGPSPKKRMWQRATSAGFKYPD